MEFFRRASGRPADLAIFPGSFNPPTRAHMALARSALECAGEVVFVIPRVFPHKGFEGASFEQRIEMLRLAARGEPGFSIAATEGGLFIEIARECRKEYGAETRLYFICGRDAAERIVNWDYGESGAFVDQLQEYSLLVAPRQGGFEPFEQLRGKVFPLQLDEPCDQVSATEVRERVKRGEAWEHLVPETIVNLVREIYS